MSSEGRPLGFARRCQVQLFFSCLMVQSVSRTRRQLGVPAHRHHRVLAPRCSGRRRSSPHPPLTATVPYHPGLLSAVSAGTASSASWSSRTSCSGLHCTSSRASVPSLVSIALVDAMWFAVVHSPACPALARHESTTALVPDPPRPRGALDAAPWRGRRVQSSCLGACLRLALRSAVPPAASARWRFRWHHLSAVSPRVQPPHRVPTATGCRCAPCGSRRPRTSSLRRV